MRATGFHRQILPGLDVDRLPLSALPVSDERQLVPQFGQRIADPAGRLDGLQAFCADRRCIATPQRGRYWIWESSGSSGQPGVFMQDEQAMAAVHDTLEALRRRPARPLARMLDPLNSTCASRPRYRGTR